MYTVEGINSDVEYVPGPRYAQICMDSHDKFWADSLTVRDCTFSKTDPGGATFLLRSRSPASSKGMCSIQNITVLHGENRAFLAVDDPLGLWRATVGGCPHVHPEVPWVEYARPGSVGHARVVLDDFAAEPTAGVWREGTELHLSPPPATGPLILKCTGAGDYGTATHPTWRGIP